MTGLDQHIDPRVQAALIAATIVALGWLYNGYQNRARDRRRRLERVQDVQTALLAEIEHYVQTLKLFDLNTTWSRIVSAMEEDDTYVPVVPSERNDTLFKAVIAEIHVLPEEVIQPVMGYYNQVFAVEAIIEDLRSALFHEMDQVQRIGMYTDYIALKKEALVRGEMASAALRHSMGNGPKPAGSVNSRGAGPSGQS